MIKVLFIPQNSIQAKAHSAIIKALPVTDISFSILTLDKYSNYMCYRADKSLQELGIPFKRIEQYGTEEPRAILEMEQPDILVVPQDTIEPFAVLLMQNAKKKGIPVLVIQNAFFFKEPHGRGRNRSISQNLKTLFYYASRGITFVRQRYTQRHMFQMAIMLIRRIVHNRPNLWGQFDYTKIAVIGDYMEEVLISEGTEPSKIVVTGEPRWDELISLDIDTNKVFEELNLDNSKGLVLLTTQPFVEAGLWSKKDRVLWLSSIVRAVNSIPELQLLVKLHPTDRKEAYEEILKEENLDKNIRMYQDFDIFKLLKACDVLLTHICTTALEAMMVDKPVIIVDYKDDPSRTPFVSSSAAIGVHRLEELAPTIERVLHDPQIEEQLREARRSFVYHQAYIQDGQASKRVADLIIQMIEESRSGKTRRRKLEQAQEDYS